MPDIIDPNAPVPSIFWGNAKPGSPLSYQALQTRRKIAESLMGKRSPFPKTLGEGLTYAGERFADVMDQRQLDAQDQAYQANFARLAADVPGAAPSVPPSPGGERVSAAPEAVPSEGTATAAVEPPSVLGPNAPVIPPTPRRQAPVATAANVTPAAYNPDAAAPDISGGANAFSDPGGGRPGGPAYAGPSGNAPGRFGPVMRSPGGNTLALPEQPPPGRFTTALGPTPTPRDAVAAAVVAQDEGALPPNARERVGGAVPDVPYANPPITTDITPTRTAQLGSIPAPNAALPPQPLAPQVGGRPPTQPLQMFSKPDVPIMDPRPTNEEVKGMMMLRQFPGDPNILPIAQQWIDYGKRLREAAHAQKMETFKSIELPRWIAQQEAAQKAPETEAGRLKAEADLARQRQTDAGGGITPEQQFALIEKSHKEAEPLIGSTMQIRNAQRALPEMITGAGADAKVNLSRLMTMITGKPVAGVEANQAYQNYISAALTSLRSAVAGPGGSQSNAELKTLQGASGANPNLEPGAISKILNAIDKLNVTAAIRHQQKLATFAGDATDPAYEKRKSVAYNNFGLPMADMLPPAAASVLQQRANTIGKAAAIAEIDRRYHTPGLGQSLLGE